jgi:hypothetical protein
MSSTSAIQPSTWLQQLPSDVRVAFDGNKDGRVDTSEVVDFLTKVLEAVRQQPSISAATSSSGAIVTKPTVPGDGASVQLPDQAASTSPASSSNWKDFIFGNSTSGHYAGVMMAPTRDVPSGYQAGPYRHQLEGFNRDKLNPAHADAMTLKYIAARVFEQIDVYSETALDDAIRAFNDAGIPAKRVEPDKIDFGNGEGPIDVIRNAAWLDGDKSAGMGWWWGVEKEVEPLNFTMEGVTGPIFADGTRPVLAGTPTTGSGTVADDSPVSPTPPVEAVASPGVQNPYAPGAVDAIDLTAVRFLHADIGKWAVTSTLTDVEIGKDSITLDHSKAGQWPVYDFGGVAVEGNPWVLVNRGGTWYAATYDWLRPGQVTKQVSASDIGASIKAEPLASWTPQPGETVGFMVSTIARNGDRTSNERSNVVFTKWPA